MHTTAAGRAIRDQGGVAVVLTLLILLILASLAMAFAMLGASEPQIAANFGRSAEAMGLAEAGIERVIWALNNPAEPGGLAYPLPATIPDPYNGATDIALGTGVYRITVTANGTDNTEAVVAAEARVPDWASYRARRIVTAIVTGLPYLNPPCAVCMKGNLTVQNKSILDGRTSSCGSKQASHSTGSTTLQGDSGYGVFANDANPSVPNEATDYSQNVAASSFDAFKLTQDQLNFLKEMAKANGTYYKGVKTFTGTFPSGIIFVDTVSGNPIDPLNPADFGSLTIDGEAGTAKGWIVVMGNFTGPRAWLYSGLIYVANQMARYRADDLTDYESTLSGAIVIQNISGSTTAFTVAHSGGSVNRIQYNCDNIRTGGGTYPPFFVKPGSWRELSG